VFFLSIDFDLLVEFLKTITDGCKNLNLKKIKNVVRL